MAEAPPTTGQKVRLLGLVLPTWLTLGILLIIPLSLIFILSFAERGPTGAPLPINDWWQHIRSGKFLDNYKQSLGWDESPDQPGQVVFNPVYLLIMWRSFWMAALTTILCLVVSYPIAYTIAVVVPRRWRNLLLALVVIPFWTSFIIRTYAWIIILRTRGLLNLTLMSMGIINEPLDLLHTELAVMIGLVYGELPFMILPLYASLEKLDHNLLEAAADLGASRWAAFRRVTLPLSAPGLAAGVLLVFIPSIGQFVISDLLGGGQSELIGNLIYRQFVGSRNWPFGAALSAELALLVMVMLLLYLIYARRRGENLL